MRETHRSRAYRRHPLRPAVRAPSVHNSQPWRWHLGHDRLDLYADFGRQLTATDPRARALMVSCGAALHHLGTALAMLGRHATIHRLPDPTRPDHLATITCTPHTPTDLDRGLAAAITTRRSDRRRYPAPVPPADLRAITTPRRPLAEVLD
ncbi:hypothetical protein [Nocardia rhizosphaerae]|uniref:Nitroreductase family protein n=1 Tax=Nocardia rhizosphaerae TaxID=1691571 RepID=A0ABV8LC40_9NOCA